MTAKVDTNHYEPIQPLIGCVQHDCAKCAARAAERDELRAENARLRRMVERKDAVLVDIKSYFNAGNKAYQWIDEVMGYDGSET